MSATRPWSGLKVLELEGLCSAYATRLWAALGAEVVVMEDRTGHPYRHREPFAPGHGAPEGSLWWSFLGQGKRSVVVEPDGPDADRLLEAADVVIGDWDPRRGSPVRRRPDQVWVAISPFGLTGPRADWRGSDLVAWSSAGLAFQVGFPDRPPVALSILQFASHVTAMHAVPAAMLALRVARMTGQGQLVDISMQEANLTLFPEIGVPLCLDDQAHRSRPGNRRAVSRPFGLYPCTDGYASIIIVQPAHWRSMAAWLAEVTGVDAVLDDAFVDLAVRWEAAEFIDGLTEQLCGELTKHELFVEGQRRGIPITPVNTVADLRSDEHLDAAGYWQAVEDPDLGTLQSPGPPFRADGTWWAWERAPRLGEHTDEVLDRWK